MTVLIKSWCKTSGAQTTPFGVASVEADADGDGNAFALNLRLPGHYADAETGWYHNQHRLYAPRLGRYLQPDPEGLAAGANRYAYAANRPLVRIDPRGCEPAVPRRGDVPSLPATAGSPPDRRQRPGHESTCAFLAPGGYQQPDDAGCSRRWAR